MKKGDLRKEALLRAAEELFFTRGYAATSVNDILETQHCSKGSFYHHFESKLEVLIALCRQHASDAYDRYRAKAVSLEEPLQRLDLICASAFPLKEEELVLSTLLMQLIATPEGEQVLSVFFAQIRALFFADFQDALKALEKQGTAYLPIAGLDELVFGAYQIQCRQIIQLGAHLAADPNAKCEQETLNILEASRYLFERTLDLPFGSMLIADHKETVFLLRRCSERIRSLKAAPALDGMRSAAFQITKGSTHDAD